MDDNRVTYFGETDARNKRVKFGIKAKDRTKHVYVIGKTGMGKSTLLENMAVQDIKSGEGMCFIDPHGKTADLLLEYVPQERISDVIYIAPFDTEYPISFNVLESVEQDKRHLVVSGLMSTFKKIWVDAWSARMEYILTNTLLALLEYPGSTLLGVNRMLSDKEYRKEVVSKIQDPSVRTFWTKEFAGYTERMAAEAVPAIQNKVGQFTANPLIRNMIGQSQSSFDFRKAMDERKIIIINLSKGKIGDENMKLLGGLLVTKIYLAAMSRADLPERTMRVMPQFYLFVDEFQNFANATFADILSEARKYKLNLTIAHQYIEQMDEDVGAAVFGNVGTMIVFRVGATDAESLEKEFAPEFEIEDLVNLGFAQVYLKLMIDGLTSSPFSAVTLPPIPHPDTTYVNEIIASSRGQFSRPRSKVEQEIIEFHSPTPKTPTASPSASAGSTSSSSPSSMSSQSTRPTMPSAVSSSSMPTKPPASSTPTVAAPTNFVQKPVATPKPPQPQPAFKPASPPSRPPAANMKQYNAKPASSSSLSGQAKKDPKVQDPKNVSELRNALAAVLKKEPVRSEAQPKPFADKPPRSIPQGSTPTVSVPSNPPKASSPASLPADPAPTSIAPASDNKPAEVPENVLKNVLKVD